MKKTRNVVLTALLTLSAFCAVLYTSCKKEIDPCHGVTCLNGGACNGGKCICTNGYTGTYCETPPDPCASVTCQNGGTCSAGVCNCPTGFEGTLCETKSRDKFLGVYVGTELCTIGTDAYTLTLSAHSEAIKLIMSNIYNNAPPLTANCTMAAKDSFTFAGVSGIISFSGTGRLVANTLTVRYTITDGATSNSCVFTGDK